MFGPAGEKISADLGKLLDPELKFEHRFDPLNLTVLMGVGTQEHLPTTTVARAGRAAIEDSASGEGSGSLDACAAQTLCIVTKLCVLRFERRLLRGEWRSLEQLLLPRSEPHIKPKLCCQLLRAGQA